MDLELLHSIHSLQRRESFQRNLARSCHKHDHLRKIFLFQLRHKLPKPRNLWTRCSVTRVLDVCFQVSHINIWHSTHQQFQFQFIKYAQVFFRDQFVETFHECADLWFNIFGETQLCHELHVLRLVCIVHHNLRSIRHQLHNAGLSEFVVFCSHSQIENIGNIILKNPHQRLVVIRIQRFKIVITRFDSEHVFVKRSREVCVQ
mmetsp:Transcript_11085/g.20042  ORF Transcript_11085/g.20042 Transcript_11085/m.20042 type:complete len:203 (+) Transcript_11085:841-1449(+)